MHLLRKMALWSTLQDLLTWPRETLINKPRHRRYIQNWNSYAYSTTRPSRSVKVYDPEYVQYRDDLHSSEPGVFYPNYRLLNPKPRFVGADQAIESLRKIILSDPTMQALLATAPTEESAAKLFNRRLNQLISKTIQLPGSDAAFEENQIAEEKHGTLDPDLKTAMEDIDKKLDYEEDQERQRRLAEQQREEERQERRQQQQQRYNRNVDAADYVDAQKRRATETQQLQDSYIRLQRVEDTVDNSPIAGAPVLSGKIWEEVMLALAASNYAYQTEEADPPPTISDVVWIYDLTAQPSIIDGFVGWCAPRDMIVMGFKGTNSIRDAKTDANTFTTKTITSINGRDLVVPLEGHSGFIYRFLNLFPQVIKDVNALLQRGPRGQRTKMLITGHSLGGALATVAAIVFAQLYPQLPIQLITFEAPRSVTKKTLSKLLGFLPTKIMEENAIRFSCKEDPVPNVPTQNMGYSHLGRSYYVTEKDASSFDQHSLDTVKGYLRWYATIPDADKKRFMPLTNGRGMVSSTKGTDEMRKRMAYVRSFRKTKMN